MKSVTGIFLVLAMFLLDKTTYSQDCVVYFPQRIGAILETTHYDSGNKPTGYTRQRLLRKTGTSKDLGLDVEVTSADTKGKDFFKKTITLKCKSGIFMMDMSSFIPDNPGMRMEGMELKFEGTEVAIPGKLSVGQRLTDAETKISVMNQGMAMMTIIVKITNRKVAGIETVKTSAGSFECFKISQDIEINSMFSSKMHMVDWIARDTGIVKTELFDEKNKRVTYSVLTLLK